MQTLCSGLVQEVLLGFVPPMPVRPVQRAGLTGVHDALPIRKAQDARWLVCAVRAGDVHDQLGGEQLQQLSGRQVSR